MQGFVEQIGEKPGMGRNGPYTLFSVKVGGEWLGAGFKKPECNQGDCIDYEIAMKGQYKNIANIKLATGGSAQAQNTGVATAPPAVRIDTRDISIRYQSCRKDAIAVTNVLLANDALKLPAKQADKVDAALAFIEDITNQYYVALQGVMDEGGISVEDLIPTPENE